MLHSVLSTPQAEILEHALSAASLRHKVISNNVANVNTPGFKKSEIPFEQYLAWSENGKELVKTHERHFGLQKKVASPPSVQTGMITHSGRTAIMWILMLRWRN